MANVDTIRPPITARPSGADCAPPSPIPMAIGTMPNTMAAAVIKMARRRLLAPSRTASCSGLPSCRKRSANETSRIEFATAIPIAMIAPMND